MKCGDETRDRNIDLKIVNIETMLINVVVLTRRIGSVEIRGSRGEEIQLIILSTQLLIGDWGGGEEEGGS